MENSKKSTLSKTTRLLTLIGAIALFITIFVPIWKIELTAPQYPEGLEMFIHADKLSGEIDIINGLNHYIGMKELHADDFKEFLVLPFILGFFSIMGILVVLLNNRILHFLWVGLFFVFGIAVVFDFYFWLQDYGSNLDPKAAIQVPGMTYDPPMLGFKQLLNFGAYSIPAIGGSLLFGVVGLMLFSLIVEFRVRKKKISIGKNVHPLKTSAIILLLFTFFSCSNQPKPIQFGVDDCDHCKMKISDERFGAELLTKKGRIYKFDDIHCLLGFIDDKVVDENQIQSIWGVDFVHSGNLVDLEKGWILQNKELKSPMGSNAASFQSKEEAKNYQNQYSGNLFSWKEYTEIK